jgi:hypothetical protein
MDVPFSALLFLIYDYELEKTNPKESMAGGWQHLPAFRHFPGGYYMNYLWYSSLASRVQVPKPVDVQGISEPKAIPASFNNSAPEFEKLRVIDAAAQVLNTNLKNCKGTKYFVIEEEKCLVHCTSMPKTGLFVEEFRKCKVNCKGPKKALKKDLEDLLQNWRNEVVDCLGSHAVDGGDGSEQAYDKCLDTYSDKLVSFATQPGELNKWVQNYTMLFEDLTVRERTKK